MYANVLRHDADKHCTIDYHLSVLQPLFVLVCVVFVVLCCGVAACYSEIAACHSGQGCQ
jgi:hypothetical protein